MLGAGGFQICISSTTPTPTPASTCPTAAVLCNKNPFSVATFPNNSNALAPSCFGNSFQRPVFYQFTVGQTGSCVWTADPTGAAEYDWVMYNITGGCPNNGTAEFGCNFNFANETGAPIGMATGSGTSCPIVSGFPSAAGEFCPALTVTSGQTYLIIIDNYSDNNVGFNFTWGGTFTIAPTSQFTPSAVTSCSPPLNVSFVNTSVAAASQVWNFGNGNTSTAVTPPNQNYTTPGTYIVSLTTTSATGCQDIVTSNITIGTPPTVTVPASSTVCVGATVPAATFTSNPAGATYTWTNSNPAIGLAGSGSANIPAFTATNGTGAPINGVISVTPTLNGCSGAPESYTITVDPSPTIAVNSPSICNGSVTLIATGADTYTWPGTATPLNPDGDSASVSPAVTTTYLVTGTTNGCPATATATVTVANNVTAPTTAPVTYCQNDVAIALTATTSPGGTLNWYGTNATGGTASATAPTPSTTTAGTTTYYVSQTVTGCEGPRASILVTVNATPAAPTTAPLTYCQSDVAVALTATASAGGTLNWYGTNATGGTASATAPTPSTATAGTTTYYVSQTILSCEGPRASILVTVNATPAAPATAPVTYCQSDVAVALTATASAGGALNWYGTNATGGTASATAPTPSTATAGTTTYYVSQTILSCEGPRASILVTVNATPAAPATAPVTYCQNDVAAILTATASAGGTLNWYGTNATGGTASATAPTPSTATAGTNTYYVSQTILSCEGPRGSILVTVNAIPNPPAAANLVYCQNQAAAQLSATPAAGGTLNWYGTNATGGTASPTAPTPSTATAGTTTYYVSQSILSCESSRTPITVTVNGTPAAPATIDTGYCQSATAVSLASNATASAGGTLNWYGTNATGGLASGTAPTPSTAILGITTYYVSQSILGCEGPRAPINVLITPVPAIPVTAPLTYCQNDLAPALTATVSPGGTLNWYGTNASGGTASVTAPTPSTAGSGTTTYYVSQTVAGCESAREDLLVTVNPTPAAPATNPVTYCEGATAIALSATASGGSTLGWYGTNATGGAASAAAPIPSTAIPGTFTYYVSQSANNCESPRAPLLVTINELPEAPITAPVIYCVGNSAQALTANLLVGGSANWYGTNATGGPASAIAPTPSTAVGGVTTYYVSQTYVGCEGPRAPLPVTVNALPTAAMVPLSDGCAPACRNMNLVTGDNLVSWNWNLGNGTFTGNDSITNHCYEIPGTYTLSVLITDINGCSNTMPLGTINVFDSPVAEFGYGPEAVTILEPEIYFSNYSTGTNITSWNWQFGDPGDSTSNVQNPIFLYEEIGMYNVTLTVVNQNGCRDSVTHPIYIPEDWAIYVPTAFSPNGDGVNDGFHADGIGIDRDHYKMWIFDRWGNQLFYTDDWDKYWDGKVQGHSNIVQEDVYVWKIQAKSFRGDKYSNTGHVTVVR
jgi:gliding motility-associated-like protein